MKTSIITSHGINVQDADYGVKFWGNLSKLNVQADFRTAFWAAGLNDEIRRWAPLYKEPKFHAWSIVGRLLAPVVSKLKTSVFWTRLIETERHEKIISNAIISEMRGGLSDGAERFIFVGHSLGSIVVVQAIQRALREKIITPAHVFGIVTLGAALSQWREPRELQAILKAVPVDRWTNIYDEFDFIAGPMAPIDSRIEDKIVRLRGWFSSHIRYWDSLVVAKIIAAMATPVEPEPPKPITKDPPPPDPPQTPEAVPIIPVKEIEKKP